MKRLLGWGALSVSLGFGACAGDGDGSAKGPALKVAVAPLTLPGVADVCYTLEVQNDQGQTVWTREHVCSSRFGDSRGDVTYIGTCDAQDGPDTDTVPNNTVTLTLEHLYTADADPLDYGANTVPDAQWQNPCGTYRAGSALGAAPAANADGYGPCQLVVPCRENADTLVEFNLTVMRSANQGFFDVAVNFEDIFCSAKVDTCYANGDEIELLFRPNGSRGPTAVFALACTAGPGADVDSVLHLSSIAVACVDTNGTTTLLALDPTVGPGNAWAFAPVTEDPAPADYLFQYAVYEGSEALGCDDATTPAVTESCNKRYWNVALGIDPALLPAGQSCSITAFATASDGGFPNGDGDVTGALPAGEGYPVIEVEVPIASDGGTPAGLACTRNPLDEEGSGVVTSYTPVGGQTCPLALCYFGDGAATTHVETWQDFSAENIPGITWAPLHYMQYLEATGESALSLEAFCSQAVSSCCVENWLKVTEAIGVATSLLPPYPTTDFCLVSPCVETYLKYGESGEPNQLVTFADFVAAGLCTSGCTEEYLKYAEAFGGNGDPSIIEIFEAGVCTAGCVESFLQVAEAVGGQCGVACANAGGSCVNNTCSLSIIGFAQANPALCPDFDDTMAP